MNKVVFNNKFNYIVILLTILFACSLIVSVHDVKDWIGSSFPGFLFYSNSIVGEESLAEWTGAKNGVHPFDKILEVDGIYFENSSGIYDYIKDNKSNTLHTYKILRNNSFVNIDVPSMEFTFKDFFKLFGPFYLLAIVTFITGFLIYYLKPNLIQAKYFYLFSSSFSLWFISSFDSHTNHILNFETYFFLSVPTFFILLAFVFPSEKKFYSKYKTLIVFLSFLVSLIFILLHQIYSEDPSFWHKLIISSYVYLLIATITLFSSLFYSYFKSKSKIDKQRSFIVLLGSFFGFVLPATLGIFGVIYKYSNINYLIILILFFPISIAYSIVKHKLFDIDLIVQKTIQYATLTAVVASLFIFTILGFNLVFSTKTGWQNPAFFFILSGLLVVALNPLKDRIQSVLDKAFFRKKYDYRSTISEVSDAMTSVLDINEIASKVISTVSETMFVDPCTMLILNSDSGEYVPYSSNKNRKNLSKLDFNFDSKLINFFYGTKKELFKEDILSDEKFIGSKEQLLADFDKLDASLILPIAFKDQLLGLLCLGEKKSGQMYNSNDLTLLKTLANQTAIAVENSSTFKLVEDYASELEVKNKKLIDIQSQLIHAEKMSAIGLLASGIAHEIRNPLNIIEGARFYLASHLQDNNEDHVAGQYLEYIQNEVKRTNKLIDEILQFSKPSTSDYKRINLNNLINNVLILTRKQINDSYIKVERKLDLSIPDVYVDSSQIWQVFINIIMNAVQAMSRDGELLIESGVNKIDINSEEDSGYVYVIFRDQGVGINHDDLPKIFDPFYTTKASGTGLGLSVSYKIIEAHDGRIMVTSQKGEGTNFMVEIPVKNRIVN